MRPIKWKEILQGLTLWGQKITLHNWVESALKMRLIFCYFENYSKSARGMILFLLVICYCTLILYKSAEKPTVIRLFTQSCFKSRVDLVGRSMCQFMDLLFRSFLIIAFVSCVRVCQHCPHLSETNSYDQIVQK